MAVYNIKDQSLILDSNIVYSIDCLPEDLPVRDNAIASGDDAFDKEVEDKILKELDSGNQWAWCQVRVTATMKDSFGHTVAIGVSYLGACSCKDENDFINNSGYHLEMKSEAEDDLIQRCRHLVVMGKIAEYYLNGFMYVPKK